jgi:5-methylcytosine-specific restriction endonuclease McrA
MEANSQETRPCSKCGGDKVLYIRPNDGRRRFRCKPCESKALKEYCSTPEKKQASVQRLKDWNAKPENKLRRKAYFDERKEYFDQKSKEREAKKKADINRHVGKHSDIHYLSCCICNAKKTRKHDRQDVEFCDNCKAKIASYYNYGGLFRECVICKSGYNAFWGNQNTCSKECRHNRHEDVKRSNRSVRKYKRRAIFKSQFVEPVYKKKIFERDKWRCKACKVKVTDNTEDHKKMATIDHIVPLSRGGSHSMSNVQTLCFVCNSKKSSKAEGQQITIFCKTQ